MLTNSNHVALLAFFLIRHGGHPVAERRLVVSLCQRMELALRDSGVEQVPSMPPPEAGVIHPMSRVARKAGSTAFDIELVRRFMCRGGGYVTCKDEVDLASCGITSQTSRVANRLAGEFAARIFMKTSAEFALWQNKERQLGYYPAMVLVQDCSTVFRQPVLWFGANLVGTVCVLWCLQAGCLWPGCLGQEGVGMHETLAQSQSQSQNQSQSQSQS